MVLSSDISPPLYTFCIIFTLPSISKTSKIWAKCNFDNYFHIFNTYICLLKSLTCELFSSICHCLTSSISCFNYLQVSVLPSLLLLNVLLLIIVPLQLISLFNTQVWYYYHSPIFSWETTILTQLKGKEPWSCSLPDQRLALTGDVLVGDMLCSASSDPATCWPDTKEQSAGAVHLKDILLCQHLCCIPPLSLYGIKLSGCFTRLVADTWRGCWLCPAKGVSIPPKPE